MNVAPVNIVCVNQSGDTAASSNAGGGVYVSEEHSGQTEKEDICFQWWSKCVALCLCFHWDLVVEWLFLQSKSPFSVSFSVCFLHKWEKEKHFLKFKVQDSNDAKAEEMKDVLLTYQRWWLPSTAMQWRWWPRCLNLFSAVVSVPEGRTDPLWQQNPSHSANTHLQEAGRWKRERGERKEKDKKINGFSCWYFKVVFILNGSLRKSACIALLKSSTYCLIHQL